MKAKLFIDKMPETCDFCEFNDYSEGGMCILHYGVCPVGERADFCPLKPLSQVEAIPIEFIEKYAQLSDDAGALFGVPVGVLKNVYRSLIDEWRKENK